ncbi:MAG: hypothetical protein M1831_005970 [Alyxoria varia]|nr:MAG: hypothetical protein M1831_005970 [Alyxoria varia]
MSFGKLYSFIPNARSIGILAAAKDNKLDLELVETKPSDGVSTDYQKLNKLGRVPTFVGTDNYVLTECLAIAVYVTSQNEKTTLLGKTKQDYASILRWMSFGNSEVLPQIANWFRPLTGQDPYNKKNVETSQKSANQALKVLEDHLMINTFLVGERITLADLMVAGFVSRGFENVLDKKWRQDNPSTTRWYETIVNQPIYNAVIPEAKFCAEALKNQPPTQPKKEAKKEQPKPKAKEPEDEEDEPAPAPKAKHPLEALGRPSFAIDDWKRKFKNEETREVALPWFWENVNFEEYSIWRVDYKYNDELTMTFMSANLVGGFYARLEASRKYLQGCMSVYGKTNDSVISGAWLVRGQEAIPAFDVAPDWESYEFTKLDPKKSEDKTFFEDQMAWDKNIEVGGKTVSAF